MQKHALNFIRHEKKGLLQEVFIGSEGEYVHVP